MAVVFMAGTPPLQMSTHDGSVVDLSAAAQNAVAGSAPLLTLGQLHAAEELLHTPIMGTTPADIPMEAAH